MCCFHEILPKNAWATQCGIYKNLLSRFFGKNFVKVTVLLKKLLNKWFDEIFFQWVNFRDFQSVGTTWKLRKTVTLLWHKFRESNAFTKENFKDLIRACKIPIFSKSRDWDYPDFKFLIPGLVFRDWRLVKMCYFGEGLLASIHPKKSPKIQNCQFSYNFSI